MNRKIWKWIYGPQGPMAMAIADSQDEARALIVEFQKKINGDDDDSSWLDECDIEVIELDTPSRVIATA